MMFVNKFVVVYSVCVIICCLYRCVNNLFTFINNTNNNNSKTISYKYSFDSFSVSPNI